jgi:hypothetical protein
VVVVGAVVEMTLGVVLPTVVSGNGMDDRLGLSVVVGVVAVGEVAGVGL